MLQIARRLANFIYPFNKALVVVGLCFLAGFFFIIFQNNPQLDKYLLPLAICCAWVVCLMGIGSYFRLVPDLPTEKIGFFKRLKIKFHRGIAFFWALCFSACSLMLIYMSIRSLFILFSA